MRYSLKILQETRFKTSSVQSVHLPDSQKVSVSQGREFQVLAYQDRGNHVKVTLDKNVEGRNTWVAYNKHIRLEDENGVFIIGEFQPGEKLPETVNLPVPYFSQRDNRYDPSGTCNVTCVASVLAYFDVQPETKAQIEDYLYQQVQQQGWNEVVHSHLSKLMESYGLNNTFSVETSWETIKRHLANRNPVIYSGKLTASGHLIVLRGYDKNGFFVNDPWGEYYPHGYQATSGENLHYSYELLKEKSEAGLSKTWAHLPEPGY